MKLMDFYEEGEDKIRLRLPQWNEYAHLEFSVVGKDPVSFGPWCKMRDVIPSPDPLPSMMMFPGGHDDWERWAPPEGTTFEELAERFEWEI